MDARDAIELLATAVDPSPGIWVDLGAGTGTFTRALATIIGPPSRIYAIDADARALESIGHVSPPRGVEITRIAGDFTTPTGLAAVGDAKLNGILAANSLHFVRETEAALAPWVSRLAMPGNVVVIEYDRRAASRWVPYPLWPDRLAEVASKLGLDEPRITATRPSEYSGELYVATMARTKASGGA